MAERDPAGTHHTLVAVQAVTAERDAAVAAEREACAKICDDRAENYRSHRVSFASDYETWNSDARGSEAESLAKAIRARGTK
ncbi:MAG TPA: hypothetical protein VMW52_02965 [Phycisphaerae bacterium]|nr:hypothetical protein [Phycisphaerae bacterium]